MERNCRGLRRSCLRPRAWLTHAFKIYLTDFIPPRFFALGDQKTHVLAKNQTGNNAVNHSPVNGPRCSKGLFTMIGLNRAASTHQPAVLHTSSERNRGKWTKIGAKRGKRTPKSALPPPQRLLRTSPQETLHRRPGMRFAHSASPQRHPVRRGACAADTGS